MKDLEYLNPFEIATHLNAFATNSKRLDSAVTKLQTANQKQQFVNKSPTQRKGTTQQCPTSTGSQPVSSATRHSVASSSLETTRSAENQSMESVGNISYANIFRSTSVDKNVQSKGNLLQSNISPAGYSTTHTSTSNRCANMDLRPPGMVPALSGHPYSMHHIGHMLKAQNRPQLCPQFAPNQTLFHTPGALNHHPVRTPSSFQTISAQPVAQVPDPTDRGQNIQYEHSNRQPPREDNNADNHLDTFSAYHNTAPNIQEARINEGNAAMRPSGLSNEEDSLSISGAASGQTDDVFIGVRPEKKKRFLKYYVSNIDERSTRKGIMSYFSNNGVVT